MGTTCGCGHLTERAFDSLGCLECGEPCCPSCAIPLESATYCQGCARTLLEAREVRSDSHFELR